MEKIHEDLLKFVRKDLTKRFSELRKQRSAPEIEAEELRLQRYGDYIVKLSGRDLSRLATEGGPWAAHQYMDEIIERYIKENETPPTPVEAHRNAVEAKPAIAFPKQWSHRLSETAGGMCSNIDCLQLTGGVISSAHGANYDLGEACLIPGAAGGKKVDDLANGIWLCTFHAKMVTQAPGDYPPEVLLAWKEEHEAQIKACREGRKRVFIAMNQQDNQSALAGHIILFFAQQKLLYLDLPLQNKEAITGQVTNISAFLIEQDIYVTYGTKLQEQIFALDALCDAFLDRTEEETGQSNIPGRFLVFRKLVGLLVNEIALYYGQALPDTLKHLVPQYDLNNPA